MGIQYQLLLKPEGTPGPVHAEIFGGDEHLEVRDLATRATIRISAHEISPYRHTLFMNGRPWQIMNVIRQ